jgi:DNA-binding PadR family transcriptional regulator
MNDLIILGLLVEGPKHGYRLKQDAAMLAGVQRLHNNTVYPLLKRFQKNGWITKNQAEGERGQTRLMYALTPAGRKELVEKLADFPESEVASAPAFRLRVGLFDELERADRERILRLRDEYLAARLERVRLIGKSREIGFWGSNTVAFVVKELQLERKWIQHLMEQI